MLTVEPFLDYAPRVDRALHTLVTRAIDEHQFTLGPDLIEVGTQHGKHLRADLILLGALVYRAEIDLDLFARASAAIELQHTSVLIHDDVVDQDALRRGQPSFHRKMLSKVISHTIEAETLAVVGADWLFSVALREITLLPVRAEIIARLFQQLTSTGISTCLGELRDLTVTSTHCSWSVAEETALLKTAYYTGVAPLRMGAILAGATDAGERLEKIGLTIGRVFQLQDDLIGVFESAEQLGKNVASDVVQNRCSTLIAAFLESASPVQRQHYQDIRSRLTTEVTVPDTLLAEVRQLFIDSGARTRLEEQINVNIIEARSEIERLEIPERAQGGFEELITRLEGRRR